LAPLQPIRRLNPFAFPSGVTIRFILLIMTLPVFGVFISLLATYGLFAHFSSPMQIPLYGVWFLYSFPMTIFVAIPALTALFYFADPQRKIRKLRLMDLRKRYPQISDLISRLCERIGIKHSPAALWFDDSALDPSYRYNADVFGTHRRAYIAIAQSLCEAFKAFPDLVESLLLHELSHLKNRDLVKHEIAEKLMKAYFIVAPAQLVFLLCEHFLLRGQAELGLDLVFLIAYLLYLVPGIFLYYLNGSIKRAREIYADARAASIQGTNESLILALQMQIVPTPRLKARIYERMMNPFIPSPQQRINYLRDNTGFLMPSMELGLAVGVLSPFLFFSAFAYAVFPIGALFKELFPDLWALMQNRVLLEVIIFSLFWSIGYFLLSVMLLPSWMVIFVKNHKHVERYLFKVLLINSKLLFFWFLGGFFGLVLIYLPIEPNLKALLDFANFLALLLVPYLLNLSVQALLLGLHLIWHTAPRLLRSPLLPFIVSLTWLPGTVNALYFGDIMLFLVSGIISVMFLFIGVLKYARCPSCGKRTKKYFKCDSCSAELNTWLFDSF